MANLRVQTPYYLDNKRAARFHGQHMRRGIAATAVAGGAAVAAHAGHTRFLGDAADALSHGYLKAGLHQAGHVRNAHLMRNVALGVAAGGAAYAGYHAYRQHQFKRQIMDRRVHRAGTRGRR